ncbi:MAG: hypothetical protein MZU95_08990 [Desulfomicrobium escambiense]|nr:hypothetical protein [Desulfomicrobium escambiense]
MCGLRFPGYTDIVSKIGEWRRCPPRNERASSTCPSKLVLTEEGTTFFIRNNKKLNKFKLADNVEEYGIFLDKFSPLSLQRMLLVDYVSKVEISKSEFMSSRQEIMDLSKLVVYWHPLPPVRFLHLRPRPRVRRSSRSGTASIRPTSSTRRPSINDAFLQNVLKRKGSRHPRDQAADPRTAVFAYINQNTALLPEEKNIQLLLSEKFLNNLRPFIWFIIAKFKGVGRLRTADQGHPHRPSPNTWRSPRSRSTSPS